MTKDEYVKKLEKHATDEVADVIHDDYCDGYVDGLKKAIVLAKRLDEPKKIVIPQFVADWIEEAKEYYSNDVDSLGIVYWICDHCADKESNYEWLKNIDNQKLLLNAIANGYEVEKEPKYYVKVRGFDDYYTSLYVNYTISVDTFSLADTSETKNDKTAFTKSWLAKNWPEYDAYNNAGLLEFEEVED